MVEAGFTRKFGFINWVDNASLSPFLRLLYKADVSKCSRSSVVMVVQGFFSNPVMLAKKFFWRDI